MTQVKAPVAKAATTETKAPTNGKKEVVATQDNVNGTTSPVPSVSIPKEESTDLKVARIYDLYHTVEKLEVLKKTERDLKSFKTASTNLQVSLLLTDGTNRFQTSNTEAISLLVKALKEILKDKIAETEQALIL